MSDRQDRHRFSERPFRSLTIGIRRESDDLKDRIGRRLDEMIEDGFAEEVRGFLDEGCDPSLPAFRAVGYRQMFSYLKKEMTLEEALNDIRRSTWQYARRQMTWFRGVDGLIWVPAEPRSGDGETAEQILAILREQGITAGG
jgi:tRNA dimethylallyltransferase